MNALEFLKKQGVNFNYGYPQSVTDDNKFIAELMTKFAKLKCKEKCKEIEETVMLALDNYCFYPDEMDFIRNIFKEAEGGEK